jgi:hypothetical protein
VAPRLDQRVTIRNPGPVTGEMDPVTGKPKRAAPVDVGEAARLSQKPVIDVSSAAEFRGQQDTVLSNWTILVGPGSALTSESTVIDELGQTFEIVGAVARRPQHRPEFLAAAARLISDMQT